MKLGSLRAGRDGSLIVVSGDLRRAVGVSHIAPTLQAALDDWRRVEPLLAHVYEELNAGKLTAAFELDHARLAAPLPRAFQWCDGSAYVNHVELVRKARAAEMPPSFWSDPLMYQGGSDRMLGCREDVPVASEEYGVDMEAELAVIVDDVPMGASAEQAAGRIRLLVVLNDVSLRNLIPAELAKGFGFFHGKPPTAFSPVAVTPDELGDAWDGRKASLPLRVEWNGSLFGEPDAGADMTFDFPTLIAHAAKTRPLGAGTIVGAGTVSNVDRSKGSCCIAEARALEMIAEGKPRTPFMKFGDRVRIEILDRAGRSVFGAIDHSIVPYAPPL